MSIKLSYTTVKGDMREVEFEKNVEVIELSHKEVVSIDLAPLSSCKDLKKLNLEGNELQSINLSPLRSCENLEWLSLLTNELAAIDLAPLIYCSNLEWISIAENPVQQIDLTPVFRINEILISLNQKIWSWLKPRRTVNPVYRRPTSSYSWDFLYKVAELFPNDYRVQQDILYALGLSDYGFIDSNLIDVFLSIQPNTPTEEAKGIIIRNLVEEIAASVDRGGPTTGMNLKKLVSKHGEIAIRAKQIVSLRSLEMKRVRIGKQREPLYQEMFDGRYDIRELSLTAYGYEIINSLDKRDILAYSDTLEIITNALGELGYRPKEDTHTVPGVMMSYELRKCIWQILENEDTGWDLFGLYHYLDDRNFYSGIIRILGKEEGMMMDEEEMIQRFVSLGFERGHVTPIIEKLNRDGIIYKPRKGVIGLVTLPL